MGESWTTGRFGIAVRGSTVRREVVAGVTTFLTMAYIIAVNPAVLGAAGMPVAGVAVATCLAAALASILMGLVANVPLALAPGMGLNAYFSFTVVQQMHVPWPVGLGCVALSGLIFLVLALTGLRRRLLDALPPSLQAAIGGGIGLFIGFIGLKDAGLVVANPATLVALGHPGSGPALLALSGLALLAVLGAWRVPGAMLIAIVTCAIAGALLLPRPPVAGLGEAPWVALQATIGKLDLAGALHLSGAILEITFVFLFVDVFDNLGTLVAVTRRAGLVEADGAIPAIDRILVVDALAAVFGALLGTSTVTSFVESAAGVAAGGRTGLTAVVTGLLFLAAAFVAPYAALIPLAATAPALIAVGALMLQPLGEIDWDNGEVALPAFLTLVLIPLTFSIANGLAFGVIAHAVLRLARGRIGRRDMALLVLAGLFAARFAWMAVA